MKNLTTKVNKNYNLKNRISENHKNINENDILIEVEDLNLWYAENHALIDINIKIKKIKSLLL